MSKRKNVTCLILVAMFVFAVDFRLLQATEAPRIYNFKENEVGTSITGWEEVTGDWEIKALFDSRVAVPNYKGVPNLILVPQGLVLPQSFTVNATVIPLAKNCWFGLAWNINPSGKTYYTFRFIIQDPVQGESKNRYQVFKVVEGSKLPEEIEEIFADVEGKISIEDGKVGERYLLTVDSPREGVFHIKVFLSGKKEVVNVYVQDTENALVGGSAGFYSPSVGVACDDLSFSARTPEKIPEGLAEVLSEKCVGAWGVYGDKVTEVGLTMHRTTGEGVVAMKEVGGKTGAGITYGKDNKSVYAYYFKLEEWMHSWSNEVEIFLEYFDASPGEIFLRYYTGPEDLQKLELISVIAGNPSGGGKPIKLSGSRKWKVFESRIVNPLFRGKGNYGSDIQIAIYSPVEDFAIRAIAVLEPGQLQGEGK